MDKVNLVLSMFGHKLAVVSSKILEDNANYIVQYPEQFITFSIPAR